MQRPYFLQLSYSHTGGGDQHTWCEKLGKKARLLSQVKTLSFKNVEPADVLVILERVVQPDENLHLSFDKFKIGGRSATSSNEEEGPAG